MHGEPLTCTSDQPAIFMNDLQQQKKPFLIRGPDPHCMAIDPHTACDCGRQTGRHSPPPLGPCAPMIDDQLAISTLLSRYMLGVRRVGPRRVHAVAHQGPGRLRARGHLRRTNSGQAREQPKERVISFKSQVSHGGSVKVCAWAGRAKLLGDSPPRAAGGADGPAIYKLQS